MNPVNIDDTTFHAHELFLPPKIFLEEETFSSSGNLKYEQLDFSNIILLAKMKLLDGRNIISSTIF